MSKELIVRLREAAAQRVASTAMIGADDLIAAADALESQAATPSSHWRAEGATDPHAGHYDGERAALSMGKLTDDELANGAFMNYDMPLNLAGILAGTHASPIAWMTAVKDRIRWLSRSLEKAAKAEQERDALALRVSELTCQIDRAEEAMVERDALAAELKALREQEPVNTRLLEALKDARHCIGIDRDTLVDCHTNPCTGYLDPDGALAKAEYDDVIDAADAAIARAESAIETPAKVSPCAGHAVQQEAGHEND